MNTRIKELRDHLHMNQTEFGARLNLSRSTIAGYETGSRKPIPALITSICREFNVSRAWLEAGVKPMFVEAEESDMEIVTRMMEGQSDNKKKLMRILADMPDELLDKFIEYLESKAK